MGYIHYTPEFISDMMANLISYKNPQNIIDFSAGDGALLKTAQKKWPTANLFAIDKSWKKSIPQSILGLKNTKSFCSDALFVYKHWDVYKDVIDTSKFCIALANPPFEATKSLKVPKNIIEIGSTEVPSKAPIEMIFTLLNIKALKPGGYLGIILPASVISCINGTWIRKYILNYTKLEYIIELPRSAFPDADAKSHLIIAQKRDFTNISNYDYNVELGVIEERDYKSIKKVSARSLVYRMDINFHINSSNYINCVKTHGGVKLSSLLTTPIRRGFALYGDKKCLEKYSKSYYPFWHSTNVRNGKLIPKIDCYIKPSGPSFNKNALTQKGDILFCRVGRGCIGKCALVWENEDIGIASDCIFIIRPNNLELSLLLFSFFQTSYAKDYLRAIAKGTASLTISTYDLSNMIIPDLVNLNFERIRNSVISKKTPRLIIDELVRYLECSYEDLIIDVMNGI